MSFFSGFLPSQGLYGHIQKNNARSLLLLAAFLLLFELLNIIVYVGGVAHARLKFERMDAVTTRLSRGDDSAALQAPRTPAQKELAENRANEDEAYKRGVMGIFDSPVLSSLNKNLWWITLVSGAAWFAMSWFFFMRAIRSATKARPVTRITEPRLYNLVENLSIAAGIPRPEICVIGTPARNAYAAGVSQTSAMIAVTRGLLDALDDRELEAVLAHEIMHIKNNDIRLMAVASIFCSILFRAAWGVLRHYLGKSWPVLLLLLPFATFVLAVTLWAVCLIALGGWLARHLVARARDFMADAGAVELTKDPDALASALRKIEGREALPDADVAIEAMLFASRDGGPFSTHPSPRERIAALHGALPEMTAASAVASAAGRSQKVTFAAVREAIDRMPPWAGKWGVIASSQAISAVIILVVGPFIDPNLGVLFEMLRANIRAHTGTFTEAEFLAYNETMRVAFNLPHEMTDAVTSGAFQYLDSSTTVAPQRKGEATLRTKPASCFPLGSHDPYDPGVATFRPIRMARDSVIHNSADPGHETINDEDTLGAASAIATEIFLEQSSQSCPRLACDGEKLAEYKRNLLSYISARTSFVQSYDAKYGEPGLRFAQNYYNSAVELRLMEDLRARIASGQIDPNEFASDFDALHLAAEKPPSQFIPCRTNAEWRASAFPPPARANAAPTAPAPLAGATAIRPKLFPTPWRLSPAATANATALRR